MAAGDSSGNIRLNDPRYWVAYRWVAKRTGVLKRFFIKVKTNPADGPRYAAGNGGICDASLHPVRPDGSPDMSVTLGTPLRFPVLTQNANTLSGNVFHLNFDAFVEQGSVYAVVVRNVDPDPATNYWSPNLLYTSSGLAGANGRNELNRDASDLYYGLAPQEAVGATSDSGATWHIPGYLFGGSEKYLPVYLAEYAGGKLQGQPYYSAHTPPDGNYAVVLRKPPTSRRISYIQAYVGDTWSAGTIILSVNGVPRRRAFLSGAGFLRARIRPLKVRQRQIVTLTARVRAAGGPGGFALKELYADSYFDRLVGPGPTRDLYEKQNPRRAMPLYPLPFWSRP